MLPRTALRSSRGVSALLAARPAFAARAVASRPMISSSVVTLRPSLNMALRAYSAATQLKEEVEEDFFAMSESPAPKRSAAPASKVEDTLAEKMKTDDFFAPELTTEALQKTPSPDAPEDKSADKAKALVPFHSLKGRMNSDLLKALTFKPFNLIAMSEVQKRVLAGMPEIAGGATQKIIRDAETPEETAAREEREKRGREDLLVKAKTGTGKTIAFLVPGIEARVHQIDRICVQPIDGRIPSLSEQGQIRRKATRTHVGTLVISPTRELATQIANEALKLLTWQKENQVQLLVGGESRNMQLKNWCSIRRGRKDVVVATPGRLRDMLKEPEVAEALATTDTLVLDEADTLLDMGFSDDLNFILQHLPKKRQTMFFSATVSPRIEKVANQFLDRNHTFIDCVPKNETNTHMHIPQHATILKSSNEQLPHLVRLLAHDQLVQKNSKVIVFLPTTKQTMLTATLLREMRDSLPNGLAVHEIHSRLNQQQRSRASERFRRDKGNSVLVTSDVSARGVDYPGVTRVIQIGIPSSAEQYVHRVGRTGRGGATGGRGDIILQPFEANFLAHLGNVPIKSLSASKLAEEVDGLAAEDGRAGAKIAQIDEKVEGLVPSLDPAAVEDVFMSLLGYYLSKGDVLEMQSEHIFEGLKEWSTGAGGLPQPPHVSDNMKMRLGIKPARNNQRGGRGGFGGRGGGFGQRSGGFGQRSGGFNDRSGGFGGDRAPRSFGDREDGPRRSFGGREDRAPRSFGDREDRPPRSFGDREDRPRRSFGGDRFSGDREDRPRRSFGGDREDRPRRSFGGDREDRPRRSFNRDNDMF